MSSNDLTPASQTRKRYLSSPFDNIEKRIFTKTMDSEESEVDSLGQEDLEKVA